MSPLPSFKSPPVTEVVIGARYQPVAGYSIASVGRLAGDLREAGFPVIEEKPGYDAPTERFGPAAEVSEISLEILTGPPPRRYWFLNGAGDELLQLQPDWLAANWRKVAPTAAYGRWESRWNAFAGWLDRVEASVADGAPLDVTQVEVTYINHIEPSGVWQSHEDAARVFTFFRSGDGGFLPKPEQPRVDLKYVMTDAEGNAIGRLHAATSAAVSRAGAGPVFLMSLTARGRPLGEGRDGIQRFAELGHEWIVRGFADLTTPEMHEAWGRDDVDANAGSEL